MLFFIVALFFSVVAPNAHALFGIKQPTLLDPPPDVTIHGLRISANLFFEQKVNHFDPTDTRTYQQRYHVSEEYYGISSKNHVFLLLGGEWEAKESWLNYGSWLDTARQYGALLIYLEHRYYGLSQPFSDLSTENLKYLSTHQALEDTATFIQGINNRYNITDPKWIVFGGSYAGSLAAWLRQKYPHLVAGAMASSAPLKAILDFHEYLQVVAEGMATHSVDCVRSIKAAYAQLEEFVSSCLEDVAIYQELDEMFDLCDTIETSEGDDKDLAALFEIMTDDVFANVVQYNGRPNRAVSIGTICDVMMDGSDGKTELQRLAEVNRLMLKNNRANCTDYKYESVVAKLRNVTTVASSMMRQWVYQTCTEFGFFQTSNQENPVFGSRFDASYFTDLCIDVFGESFNSTLTISGIRTTNNRYGSTDIKTGNIAYFHGNIDPWHVLGKLATSETDEDRVIMVEGVSHCANMQPAHESDSLALVAARREINELIGRWLGVITEDGNSAANRNVVTSSLLGIVLYLIM